MEKNENTKQKIFDAQNSKVSRNKFSFLIIQHAKYDKLPTENSHFEF